MTYNQFLDQLLASLQERCPDMIADLEHILTANDTYRDALLLRSRPEDKVSPALYLDDYYNYYLKEEARGITVEDVLEILLKNYRSSTANAQFAEDICRQFTRPEELKKHIVFRLVGIANNTALLDGIPYRKFHDMAMIYYLTFYVDDEGRLADPALWDQAGQTADPENYMNASALISDSHLKLWNMTEADLYTLALGNTPRLLPPEIHNMYSLIDSISDGTFGSLTDAEDLYPMWIMTNSRRLYGASCCLYPGLLQAFADRLDCNFYCLPSSVHEMILVPESYGSSTLNKDVLLTMVTEINASTVQPKDRLTDNVYYYDCKTERFEPV